MRLIIQYLLLLCSLFLVAACSDSDGGSSSEPQTGTISLGVSDSAVNDLSSVIVYYNRVALIPQGSGEPIILELPQYEVQPLDDVNGRIDLLDYQGSNTAVLVDSLVIPVGEYQACLFVLDGEGENDQLSHVVIKSSGGIKSLEVQGEGACKKGIETLEGESSMFLNNKFSVNSGFNNFVIEFDLRNRLKEDEVNDVYTLQRTALQIVNTVDVGMISGTVDINTINNCTGDDHAVYLYPGNVDQADMIGFNPADSVTGISPIAAASVLSTDQTNYAYELAFIGEGDYSVGYSCMEDDDSALETFSIYKSEMDVEVNAGQTTTVSFSEGN